MQELENKLEKTKIELEQEWENVKSIEKELEILKQEKDEMKQQYFINQEKEESLLKENEQLWEEVKTFKQLSEKIKEKSKQAEKSFEEKL